MHGWLHTSNFIIPKQLRVSPLVHHLHFWLDEFKCRWKSQESYCNSAKIIADSVQSDLTWANTISV